MTSTVTCTHYWILPSPNGKITVGKCRNCKEIKEFNNTHPHFEDKGSWTSRNKTSWEVSKEETYNE